MPGQRDHPGPPDGASRLVAKLIYTAARRRWREAQTLAAEILTGNT